MKKKILAIDDSQEFLCMLEDLFKGKEFLLKTLADSKKAEKCINKYKPDLLLIDILMPERSGFNLLEDFRSKGLYIDIPKMFVTCLDDEVEKMTAKSFGVNTYITKPFTSGELLKNVRRLLKTNKGKSIK